MARADEADIPRPEGLDAAQQIMRQPSDELQASCAADDEFVAAILEDVNGQSSEAFSRSEYYSKWGVHYLPSILFAHQMQQCNNFKDPSVQMYGGVLFEKIRDNADEEFNNLPPPKSSRVSGYAHYGGSVGPPPAPVSM